MCKILQAVFVVCVNLQGLFIFCFHCVRNTAVRSEWKGILSRIQTYTTNTSNADGPGATRNSVALQPINCDVSYSGSPRKNARL